MKITREQIALPMIIFAVLGTKLAVWTYAYYTQDPTWIIVWFAAAICIVAAGGDAGED